MEENEIVLRLDNVSSSRRGDVTFEPAEEPFSVHGDRSSPRSLDNVKHLPVENDVVLDLKARVAKQAVELRKRAFGMYLCGASPKDIVDEIGGIDMQTLSVWSEDGSWEKHLKSFNDQIEAIVRETIRYRRLANTDDEIRESLELGKKIRKRALDMVDGEEDLSAANLKNIAEAAKLTSELGARAMGETAADAKETGAAGKTPLVVVVQGGYGLPEIKRVSDE